MHLSTETPNPQSFPAGSSFACHHAGARTADALAHRNPDSPRVPGGPLICLPPRGEDPEESAQDAARQGEGGKKLPEKRSTAHLSPPARGGKGDAKRTYFS